MKLTDYIVNFLEEKGVGHVFVLTGSYIAHLIDGLHNHKSISYTATQHEQAAAMAADAYARVTNNIGAIFVTSGPGATNTLTGVACSYYDSIPVLVFTGNVNSEEFPPGSKVRQTGCQQLDIVSMAKPITKWAVQVLDPNKIDEVLVKAHHIATSGRPGPVLIDLPINIQTAQIDPVKIKCDKEKIIAEANKEYNEANFDLKKVDAQTDEFFALLSKAKRPVLLAGGGIKISKTTASFLKLIQKLKIPVVASWSGADILKFDNSQFIGLIGVYGSREANLTIQNSDLVLSLGSRLDSRQTGSNQSLFAREAKKVRVDIDRHELHDGIKADVSIHCSLEEFFPIILEKIGRAKNPDFSDWLETTNNWKEKYSKVYDIEQKQNDKPNPYVFLKLLSKLTGPEDLIITDAGGDLMWTMQGYRVKEKQQLFSAYGNSPMGYSFPASIGARIACKNEKANVVCIIGDGGMQMNIQELQTVAHNKLPIKIIIMNNNSYGSIRQFIDVYLKSRATGIDNSSGYSCPDFVKVAQAYGIEAMRIDKAGEMEDKLKKFLSHKGPIILDLIVKEDEVVLPKAQWGRPLEDQWPYLPREEFLKTMIVKPAQKSLEPMDK